MNKTIFVFKKEVKTLLFSHLTGVVLIGFSLLLPFWFFIISEFFIKPVSDFGELTQLISVLLALTVPLFTAGLWNREVKLGSDILLATLPVKTAAVVVGKFLAVWALSLVFILSAGPSLFFAVRDVAGDFGLLVTRITALMLISGLIVSFGFLVSTFSKSRILSYIITVSGILIFLFFGSNGRFVGNIVIDPLLTSSRLISFNLGILNLSDILFFVLVSAFFLYIVKLRIDLNGRKSSFPLMVLPPLFTLLLIFGMTLLPLRLDLTKERRHSLTKITKQNLSDISFPMSLTYFKSDNIDSVQVDVESIERLLSLFAGVNRNINLNIESVNSEQDGPQLKKEGLFPQAYPLLGSGLEKLEYSEIYSGIKINYNGLSQVIPFLDNINNLELSLFSAMEKLTGVYSPTVGILIADEKREAGPDFGVLAGGLSEFFDVIFLTPESVLSDSLDIIMVMGQHDLASENIVALEQFRLDGGDVVFFTGGVYLQPESSDSAFPYDYAPLLDFLNQRFGLRVERKLLLLNGDNRIETERTDGQTFESYPFWIDPVEISHDYLGRRFSFFTFLWPSPISIQTRPGYIYHTIARTSSEAWTMDRGFDIKPESVDYSKRENNRVKSALAVKIDNEKGDSGSLVILSGELSGSRLMELTNGIDNIQVIKSLCFTLTDKDEYIELERKNNKKRMVKRFGIYQILGVTLILWPLLITIACLIIGSRRRKKIR